MIRWLATVLLLLLPLQFSWAAAAQYCQHEFDVKKEHIGHHEKAKPYSLADDSQSAIDVASSDLPNIDHSDCSYCHATCVQLAGCAVPSESAISGQPPLVGQENQLDSFARTRIDRPNWQHSA